MLFLSRDLIPLPKKTKENYKVFIYRLNNPDLDMFNFVDAVKTFFMLADTRLTEEDDIPAGEVPIFDSANVSLKFIPKINLSVLRKYMLYTQVSGISSFEVLFTYLTHGYNWCPDRVGMKLAFVQHTIVVLARCH